MKNVLVSTLILVALLAVGLLDVVAFLLMAVGLVVQSARNLVEALSRAIWIAAEKI